MSWVCVHVHNGHGRAGIWDLCILVYVGIKCICVCVCRCNAGGGEGEGFIHGIINSVT